MKKVLKRLKDAVLGRKESSANQTKTPASTRVKPSPDGFPLASSSPYFQIHCRINEFLSEIPNLKESYDTQPAQFKSARVILDAPPAEQILAIEAILLRRIWITQHDPNCGWRGPFDVLRKLSSLLFRRNLPYDAAQAATVLTILAKVSGRWIFDDDTAAALKICEKLKAQGTLSAGLKAALRNLRASLNPDDRWEDAKRRRFRETIGRLLTSKSEDLLDPRDEWAETISKEFVAISEQERTAWESLVAHARTATQSKASAKWLKEADRLLDQLGRDKFKARIAGWFPLVRPTGHASRMEFKPTLPMSERNADVLKGLVWCCSRIDDEKLTGAVSDLAQRCFKKIPIWGAFSNKVGNACLFSLSQLPGLGPVAQLSRLRLKVKYSVPLGLIDRALQDAATKLGMTPEELEEIAVPTYGLDENGCLREEFGEMTAELKIVGTHDTELTWTKAGGKTQQSIPAEVKEKFPDDLKELKRSMQDIQKMLPAQRDRIERLLLSEREWTVEQLRDRYLNHPLIANIARRLIWNFKSGKREALGIWHNGKLVDVQDRPFDWLTPETRIRLWHPLGSEPKTVAAWRGWLESHQVSQPFKQAHREIYVLTDAERRTDSYSNRFAAHIIRQHQFAALARQRGWKYTLQGAFDSHNTPTLPLPRWNLEAEFWVDAVGNMNDRTMNDVSDSGIFLQLSTDQVRFRGQGAARGRAGARPLSEIPALLFSEVMRDIDLFVGVCSIGNDPHWRDSGDRGAHGAYWQEYSFGTLSETAKTRREVLERLLPRLKIAGQCSLQERFLVVRGQLRTYKIHLGSANIKMEPNDQYLCIVPDRGGASGRDADSVFLPFEGDNTLAIILSKAFLLAADTKIKDPTILRQIR